MRGLRAFLASGRFPAFMLSVLVLYDLLLLAILLIPPGAGALGSFAREFRVWCLQYDPTTRRMPMMALVTLFGEPLFLGAIIVFVWWVPLRAALRRPQALVGYVLGAAVLVGATGAALGLVGNAAPADASGALPFPAERLRTAVPAPTFTLVDQDGATISPPALRGKVVLATAVYATCGLSCPMILAQVKRVVSALSPAERDDLVILAVTLDPEHDDRAALARLAAAQEVAAPRYHLLTGAPALVNAALDTMGIERRRDPETGVIDHANLFLVIDRQGRVAYRFTLGDRQEQWLVAALRLLLAET